LSVELIIFIILGVLAIASAILTITARHPIVSAMSLVFNFLILAGLYLTLNAQFISVMQVLVYAGAIMVLVIFTLMLLNLSDEEKFKYKFDYRKIIAWMIAGAFVVELIAIFTNPSISSPGISPNSVEIGTAQNIGAELFSNYILPIEIAGILLFGAIVGAMVMAKRKITE